MDTLKKISIKSSSVKRYTKDIVYYQKELQALKSKKESLLADPETCPHVLKKQEEVMKETEAMLPECEGRLKAAQADLQEFLSSHADMENIVNSIIFKDAEALIT